MCFRITKSLARNPCIHWNHFRSKDDLDADMEFKIGLKVYLGLRGKKSCQRFSKVMMNISLAKYTKAFSFYCLTIYASVYRTTCTLNFLLSY